MAASVERHDLDRTAAAWGMGRVWRTTWRAIEHLLYDGAASVPLRSWARHLGDVRERSIFDHHLARWLSPYSELPLHLALARMAGVAREEIEPAGGESWRAKLGRMTSALRNPGAPVVRRPRATRGGEDRPEEHGAS
jgi:hypothetical protein